MIYNTVLKKRTNTISNCFIIFLILLILVPINALIPDFFFVSLCFPILLIDMFFGFSRIDINIVEDKDKLIIKNKMNTRMLITYLLLFFVLAALSGNFMVIILAIFQNLACYPTCKLEISKSGQIQIQSYSLMSDSKDIDKDVEFCLREYFGIYNLIMVNENNKSLSSGIQVKNTDVQKIFSAINEFLNINLYVCNDTKMQSK